MIDHAAMADLERSNDGPIPYHLLNAAKAGGWRQLRYGQAGAEVACFVQLCRDTVEGMRRCPVNRPDRQRSLLDHLAFYRRQYRLAYLKRQAARRRIIELNKELA